MENGTRMIGGGFRLVDERGLGLETLVDSLHLRGDMLDWMDFFDSAMRQGWKPKRTFKKLATVVGSVYGREFREEWEKRMLAHYPECVDGT